MSTKWKPLTEAQKARKRETAHAYYFATRALTIERAARWYRANRERRQNYAREWAKNKREHRLPYQRGWVKAHPEYAIRQAAIWSLRCGTGLRAKDIPPQLIAIKVTHIKLTRQLKAVTKNPNSTAT